MQKFLILSIGVLLYLTPVYAQKKTMIVDGKDGRPLIECEVYKEEVKFYIQTKGFPSIKVDVNQNGIIDRLLDRKYATTAVGKKICSSYFYDETSFTLCGEAPSRASLLCKQDLFIFSIPAIELTSVKTGFIHVAFTVWIGPVGNEEFINYPEAITVFEEVFKIKIG